VVITCMKLPCEVSVAVPWGERYVGASKARPQIANCSNYR
jgi:hypothetical protein